MERRLRAHEAQWAVQAMARGILTLGAILGTLIVIGGRARWSSPSYEIALTYPYAPASWGIVLGIASVIGIVGSVYGKLRVVAVALHLFAMWCVFFDISFIQTATANPNAATTGIPVYFGFAIGAVVLGVAHWRSSRDAVHV